jgi:hypothetical protein
VLDQAEQATVEHVELSRAERLLRHEQGLHVQRLER